jgi:hypothetical protein
MKKHEEEWREKVTNPEIRKKYGKSKYYKDDQTFNKQNPRDFLHVTLVPLKSDTAIEVIDDYLDQYNKVHKNEVGKVFSCEYLGLRDPGMVNNKIWWLNK